MMLPTVKIIFLTGIGYGKYTGRTKKRRPIGIVLAGKHLAAGGKPIFHRKKH
jgi:hypothetical protein